MSLNKLKLIVCAFLLVVLAGCSSDDHEGTFNDPGKNDIAISDSTLSGVQTIKASIKGLAAGFHVIEPATIVAISGDGTRITSSVGSDGGFDFGSHSLNKSFVLFLVPKIDDELNWEGDVQAAIIISETNGSEVVTASKRLKVTPISESSVENLSVNPITTAIALKLFNNLSVNLIEFGKISSDDSVSTTALTTEFNTILSLIDSAQIASTLNDLIKSWGVDSSNNNLISSTLFDFNSYNPRASFNQEASFDHYFIETLGLTFGKTNLGQKLFEQMNTNQLASSNLLIDKGFQEGLVFVLYSRVRLNSNNATVSELLDTFLDVDIALPQYISKLQSIVDQLILDEAGLNKTEDEILAKIKTIIGSQEIPYP